MPSLVPLWLRRFRRQVWRWRHTRPDPESRLAFAAFLDRLEAGPITAEDWANHIIGHYRDFWLEAIRRKVARMISSGDPSRLDAGQRAQLRNWARQIREHAT